MTLFLWWALLDLNQRPIDYELSAKGSNVYLGKRRYNVLHSIWYQSSYGWQCR